MEFAKKIFLLLVDLCNSIKNINFKSLYFSCYSDECKMKTNGLFQCEAYNPVKEIFKVNPSKEVTLL